jgi:PAS domain S-box-containing protein
MRMRLFREVQATSRIAHPNVVEILDYGEDAEAGCYLVMEFLHGQSLGALIRRQGRLPIDIGLKICLQLAHALSATHSHGLIHRDLKPSNIRLLPTGRVKVLDFGLVKAFERTDQDDFVTITTGGIAFGTPWYMSPEQASLRPLDPRTDIYSLGVVLYEMLVGRPPFLGNNALELIESQRKKPVPLPRHLDPPVELPIAVELLLLQMLNKDPDRRPQTMAQLVDQLHDVAHEVGLDVTETRVSMDGSSTNMNEIGRPERQSQTLEIDPDEAARDLDEQVKQAVLSQMGEFCDRVVDQLQRTFPRYRALERDQALFGAQVVTRAALAAATNQSDSSISADLKRLTHARIEQQFPLGEALGSFLVGQTEFRPLLAQVAQGDMTRLLELHRQVDQRLLPFFLRLVDDYVDTLNARLIRLNDQLLRRNEELQQLREELASQLQMTSRRLGSLERLKASLADNASSGLVVVERGTRRILLCNKAIERIFGLSRNELIDRSVDDILRRVEGVPQHEFIEQIRLHGQVGLRKLKLRMANGAWRVVYVRGEALQDGDDTPDETLFVVDDITKREELLRSLARYFPADLERELLSGRPPPLPYSVARQLPILGCQLKQINHDSHDERLRSSASRAAILPVHTAELPANELLGILYAATCEIAERTGATLSLHPPDRIVLCFEEAPTGIREATRAAEELELKIDSETHEGIPLELRRVLHLGEVRVTHIGNDKRCQRVTTGSGLEAVLQRLLPAAGTEALELSEELRERMRAPAI